MTEALYKGFPLYYSVLMVIGFVSNIAMLLVSQLGDSAVIKSSVCVGNDCPGLFITELPNISQACNNTNDLAIFSEGSNAPIFVDNEAVQREIGLACTFSPILGLSFFDSCTQIFTNFNATDDPGTGPFETFTSDCVSCFVQNIQCSGSNCAQQCAGSALAGDPATPECVDCTRSKCVPTFTECAGVEFPAFDPFAVNRSSGNIEPVTDYVCTRRVENFITMFDVFTIRFLESIELAWNGGVELLAVFVAVASGIWPHTKNVLMSIAWFAPVSKQSRENILVALAYLGKWSLVDVFFVVLIIVGVKLDKFISLSTESAVIVRAESRDAIYLFGSAAILALLQGEYIRHLNRVAKAAEEPDEKKDAAEEAAKITSESYRFRQKLVACFALLAFLFGVAGAVLVNTRFVLSGLLEPNPGPNIYEYSTIDISVAMTDECAFDCNELQDKCDHESITGTYYLAFLFGVMGTYLPLLTYLVGIVAAMIPPASSRRRMVHQLFKSMSYFSAMDVYFFSLLVLISQFNGLINSSLGAEVSEQCGTPGESCVELSGSLEIGTWMICASMIFFWKTQFGVAILLQHQPSSGESNAKVGLEGI